MIFPPTFESYEFDNLCTATEKPCDKGFQCGSCDLAWKTYKKDIEEADYKDFVIPSEDWSKAGIATYKNEPCTIIKVNSLDYLFQRFKLDGVPFADLEESFIDSEEMKLRYPYWYALKTLEDLGEPLSYKCGNDIPLIVEYTDCVYMIAPAIESD